MEKLSETVKDMMRNGKGYRNNELGTGYYLIGEIIEFETKELENEDILDTCMLLYGTTNVLQLIQDTFGTTELFGLWLTSLDGVLDNYGEEDITFVSTYDIPTGALLISDLDTEGALFVYPSGKHPKNSLLTTVEVNGILPSFKKI